MFASVLIEANYVGLWIYDLHTVQTDPRELRLPHQTHTHSTHSLSHLLSHIVPNTPLNSINLGQKRFPAVTCSVFPLSKENFQMWLQMLALRSSTLVYKKTTLFPVNQVIIFSLPLLISDCFGPTGKYVNNFNFNFSTP